MQSLHLHQTAFVQTWPSDSHEDHLSTKVIACWASLCFSPLIPECLQMRVYGLTQQGQATYPGVKSAEHKTQTTSLPAVNGL